MGVPLFSDVDNSSNANNERESEKNNFLNYNYDAKSLHFDKFSQPEKRSYQMQQQKRRCGKVVFFSEAFAYLNV